MGPVWPPVAVNSNEQVEFADRGVLSTDAVAAPAATLRERKLRMLKSVVYKIVRTSVVGNYLRYLRGKEKREGKGKVDGRIICIREKVEWKKKNGDMDMVD